MTQFTYKGGQQSVKKRTEEASSLGTRGTRYRWARLSSTSRSAIALWAF